FCEVPVFNRIRRVCFHFDGRLTRQQEYFLQAARRIKGREREEEVGEGMISRQDAVEHSPVRAVAPALLSRPEREVAPDDCSGWQQSAQHYVRAQVHMMMAVDA